MKAAAVEPFVSPENAEHQFISRREDNGQKRHRAQCKKEGRKTASDRPKETIYKCSLRGQ